MPPQLAFAACPINSRHTHNTNTHNTRRPLNLNRHLQGYYRATSRELRRLEAVARSPIYGALGDATHGAVSIRAFRAQRAFAKVRVWHSSSF